MVSQLCMVLALGLLATTVTVEAGNSSEKNTEVIKACISLANPKVAQCCSMVENIGKEKKEKCNFKDGDITCESAKCFLKEDGLDGDNIDLQKVKEKVDEVMKDHADLKDAGDRIKKHCIEERGFELYPPEDCPAASLLLCIYMNSFTECPEWKDTDECKKFAEDAKTCKSAIDKM